MNGFSFAALTAVFLLLAGCAPESSTQQTDKGDASSAASPESNIKEATGDHDRSLDLSLPEDFFAEGESQSGAAEHTPEFDAGALFESEDEDTVRITVLPHLKPSEQPHKLPDVDGGTVSIEKKTK